MVGKNVSRSALPRELLPRLVLLTVFFLAGAIIGSFFAANISGDSRLYVEHYIGQGAGVNVKVTLLRDVSLLALVFVSAFLPFGVVVIPLCLATKGFMLSMLVTYFVMTLGLKGYGAAFIMAFLYGFVTLLCLILVAAQGYAVIAGRLPGRRGRIRTDPAFFITTGIALAATVIASLSHAYLTPVLSRAVAAFLQVA